MGAIVAAGRGSTRHPTMWKLSIEDDQGHKTVVSLVRDEYTLGRAQDNTIRLTERNVSRHHAALRRAPASGWVLEDRSSYNGCFVNGARVADPRPLEHGDLVQLGDYRLELADEAVAAAGAVSTAPAMHRRTTLTGQPDRLVMLVGPTPGMEYPLTDQNILIGRGEECGISINHGSVSRVHAEVHPLGDGRYEIIDRESANGVRVNGAELQRALLDARDTIELGDIVLKYIPAGMIYRPGADESQQIGAFGTYADPLHTPTGMARDFRPPLSGAVKAAAIAGAVVVALVLGLVVVGAGKRRPTGPTMGAEMDTAARVLMEARQMLANGQIEAAHVHATSGIPETSNARQSEAFREIEAHWADVLLAQASQEPDRDRKRALLERVATTMTVDPDRRNQAATLIAALESGGVDVSQLPQAARPVVPTTAALPTPTDAPEPTDTIPVTPRLAPTPTEVPSPPTTPAAVPTPRPPGDVKNRAIDGSRASQLSAISALKGKKAAGTITDQEARLLRALCRQHGDASCSN